MFEEISAAFASLKTAGEIAKAMSDLRDASAFQTKAIDLQREILAAQSSAMAAHAAQTALVDEIKALKEEIARLTAWESERAKYVLKEVGSGVYAYEIKAEVRGDRPMHKICPRCYEEGHASILQQESRAGRRIALVCPRCGTELLPQGSEPPPPPTIARGGGSWAGSRSSRNRFGGS